MMPEFEEKNMSISIYTTAPNWFIHVSLERDTSQRNAWCQFHWIKHADTWTSFNMRTSCVV